MKKTAHAWIWVAAVAVAAVAVTGVFAVRARAANRRAAAEAEARSVFLARFGILSDGTQPFVALPPFLPHGALQAELGQRMFCERKLARTARRTCGFCHLLNEGGTDGRIHGKVMTRPAVNAVFAPFYLHDGSISNLHDLVVRMIEDPEFAGARSLDKAVLRLAEDGQIRARFEAAYPDGLTASNVVDSIVQLCHTLVTGGTPFDTYCGGRKDAFSEQQRKGMELFLQRKCLTCHDGPALGTMKMSEGRKVPALRGVSRRRAYLSDASLNDLGAVLMRMPGGEMEAEERAALVSFLKAL